MTMGDVDGCQVPASCSNPIRERVGLSDGHEGVNQDGISQAIDKGRGHRLKIRDSHIGRLVASDNRDAWRHEHVPVQKTGLWVLCGRHLKSPLSTTTRMASLKREMPMPVA